MGPGGAQAELAAKTAQDPVDQSQPESAAGDGAGGVCAPEPVDGVRDQIIGQPRSLIADLQQDVAVGRDRGHAHCPAAVGHGVVDEVAQHQVELFGAGRDLDAGQLTDRDLPGRASQRGGTAPGGASYG